MLARHTLKERVDKLHENTFGNIKDAYKSSYKREFKLNNFRRFGKYHRS